MTKPQTIEYFGEFLIPLSISPMQYRLPSAIKSFVLWHPTGRLCSSPLKIILLIAMVTDMGSEFKHGMCIRTYTKQLFNISEGYSPRRPVSCLFNTKQLLHLPNVSNVAVLISFSATFNFKRFKCIPHLQFDAINQQGIKMFGSQTIYVGGGGGWWEAKWTCASQEETQVEIILGSQMDRGNERMGI